jgi:hypothetical protein
MLKLKMLKIGWLVAIGLTALNVAADNTWANYHWAWLPADVSHRLSYAPGNDGNHADLYCVPAPLKSMTDSTQLNLKYAAD